MRLEGRVDRRVSCAGLGGHVARGAIESDATHAADVDDQAGPRAVAGVVVAARANRHLNPILLCPRNRGLHVLDVRAHRHAAGMNAGIPEVQRTADLRIAAIARSDQLPAQLGGELIPWRPSRARTIDQKVQLAGQARSDERPAGPSYETSSRGPLLSRSHWQPHPNAHQGLLLPSGARGPMGKSHAGAHAVEEVYADLDWRARTIGSGE